MPYVPLTDSGPPDLSAHYNTPLSPADEMPYQNWIALQSAVQKRDVTQDTRDYDLRGAFKAGAAQSPDGHLPDTFKKPNHPSFSNESQYHGADGHEGGSWAPMGAGRWGFTPGATNLQMHGPISLQQYFQRVEPGTYLNLPPAPLPQSMTDYVKQATG